MKTQKIFIIQKKKRTPIWSREEDELIIEYSELKLRNKWKKLASMLKGKSASQIYLRSKIVNPALIKGRFSTAEDAKLKELVETFGASWSFIARFLKSRNPKQLRLRFTYHLSEKISKSKFTKDEDQLVLRLYREHGKQWAKFLQFFPTRSYEKIKNRCASLLNKQRKLAAAENMKAKKHFEKRGSANKMETQKDAFYQRKIKGLIFHEKKELGEFKGDAEGPTTPTSSAETNCSSSDSLAGCFNNLNNESKNRENISKFHIYEKPGYSSFFMMSQQALMNYK